MARPRKTTVEVICDEFADMTVDQQDGILITLSAIHRQAKRQADRLPRCPGCGGTGNPQRSTGLCDECHEEAEHDEADRLNDSVENRTPPRE